MWHLADDGFGNLCEVPREPFRPHPEPRFDGELRACGPYAWVVGVWLWEGLWEWELWEGLWEGGRWKGP